MTDFTNTDNAFIKLRERTEYSGRHGKGNPAGGCGTAVSVLNAYTNTVLQILRGGSAVKFGELGTFLHHRQRNGGKQVLQALGDIQAITIHIADSSSEMNQGTDRILHTLKRLTELSKQVQGNSDTMSRNTQNIHQSLALIHAVIESNDATVQKLNTHAGQFTV